MFKFQVHQLDNFKWVQSACEDAMINRKMICIIGPPGNGKSFGIDWFINKNQNVYYIELGESVNPKEMYTRILNALQGIDKTRKEGAGALIRQIKHELGNRSGNSLIIIDEAGKFDRKRLSTIHELRNLTLYKCGIIISGPQSFEDDVIKWMNEDLVGVEEFYTRVNYWVKLIRPRDAEIKAIFKNEQLGKEEDEQELLNKTLKTPYEKRSWRRIEMAIQEMFASRERNKKSSKAKSAEKTL